MSDCECCRCVAGEESVCDVGEAGAGCALAKPMAAHGHVNGWREAPGWSEAEGFGGHSLSLTDIAIATDVPAKYTTGHTSAVTRSFRRLK